jgi:TPR repeat protein
MIIFISGELIMSCKDDKQKNEPILPVNSFHIDKSELPKLEKEALLGSPEAAFKLFQYYEYYMIDNKQSLYWVTISAENGHVIGQHNLAYMLYVNNNGVKDILRSHFWVKKSFSAGNKEALELLKEIESKVKP